MTADRTDFLRDIIDADLAAGRQQRVATRFPPEPNGYLHIGHAKSICLNFGIARDYQGTCNLRYDDTNPTREDVEYVHSIEADVRWLGFEPAAVLFSADYFGRMYELAERLVREGRAYVCHLSEEQIREYRGSLSAPGKASPNRDRSVDENLALLRQMKAGELADGTCVLRAKIDMASANMKMRDPLLYRIRHAHHHRVGDAWAIYPMYDYAHPIEDGIEGITHSICTLEFENNRELYDWVLDHTGPWSPRPHQYEFARLGLEYTVMSKRKLRTLVEEGHVSGWDDPRMPTIAGMRRRGFAPEAIRAFCDLIGIAKTNSTVDIGKLEFCVRDELNQHAPRALGVLRPLEVELVGVEATAATLTAARYPQEPARAETRALAFGRAIVIDRDDWRDEAPSGYQRLAPGRTVRLRSGPCITAEAVTRRDADGTALAIRATVVEGTIGGANPADGRKVSGVIHWVDAATSVVAEVRLYDRLTTSARPEEGGGNFIEELSATSLEVVAGARVEASLAHAAVGDRFQLERVGYFRVDEDTRPGTLVLNRIITLRESSSERAEAKPVAAAAVSSAPGAPGTTPDARKENAKAKTRPKLKSPAEYRIEARVRDRDLAAAHDRFAALPGLTMEQADLLSGDRTLAELFEGSHGGEPELAAKWIVNELPRALAGKELADVNLEPARLGALIAAVASGALSAPAAKSALVEIVAGKRLDEITVTQSTEDLATVVGRVVATNQDKAAQYRAGKLGLLGFFVGQVMKAAPGANPNEVNDLLRTSLA